MVGVDLGQVGRIEMHGQTALLDLAAHQPDGVLANLFQRHLLIVESQLAGLDLGHVEDVVDQAQQVLTGFEDVRGVSLVAGVPQGAEHLGLHDFRKAVDGIERRAQLVTHVGEELGLGHVGSLGPGHGGFVFAGQLRELFLADLQLVDGGLEGIGGFAPFGFLALDRGDVGGRDH